MLRALAHYFLIGSLLFSAKVLHDRRSPERAEITVQVPAAATPPAVDRLVREAILLNEARGRGWDKRDPVVFGHLVRNMRFIEPGSADDDLALYERALEMGMHQHDPIVRARLLYRAEEALGYVPENRMPTRAELEEHRTTHADRFEREGRSRFQQVFLSRTKRGDSLSADARAMRSELDALGDAAPNGLGDPLPGLRAEQVASASKIADEYGADVAETVSEGVIGVWRGPASSVYGLHFIKVLAREPATLPPLDVIAAQVRADRLREIRDELREDRMEALLDGYIVHIERTP